MNADQIDTLASALEEDGPSNISPAELRAVAAFMRGGETLKEAMDLVESIGTAAANRRSY